MDSNERLWPLPYNVSSEDTIIPVPYSYSANSYQSYDQVPPPPHFFTLPPSRPIPLPSDCYPYPFTTLDNVAFFASNQYLISDRYTDSNEGSGFFPPSLNENQPSTTSSSAVRASNVSSFDSSTFSPHYDKYNISPPQAQSNYSSLHVPAYPDMTGASLLPNDLQLRTLVPSPQVYPHPPVSPPYLKDDQRTFPQLLPSPEQRISRAPKVTFRSGCTGFITKLYSILERPGEFGESIRCIDKGGDRGGAPVGPARELKGFVVNVGESRVIPGTTSCLSFVATCHLMNDYSYPQEVTFSSMRSYPISLDIVMLPPSFVSYTYVSFLGDPLLRNVRIKTRYRAHD